MDLFYVNINVIKQKHQLNYWLTLFPINIQNEVLKYKKEADRWRVLGGKLLLKHVIQQKKLSFSLTDLIVGSKGKPSFGQVNFDFNISHSGDMVVLAFANGCRCGVDIEMHRAIGFLNFEANFTKKEWNTIVTSENQAVQFFDYWAVKESIIKADGRGFEVLRKSEIHPPSKATCDGVNYHIMPFFIKKGYSSCVTSNKVFTVLNIESWQP